MTTEQRLALLAREVERYLDNPGCNVPAQQNAKRRLRWAFEQAQPVPPSEPVHCAKCGADVAAE
jgi:hypothetical protein